MLLHKGAFCACTASKTGNSGYTPVVIHNILHLQHNHIPKVSAAIITPPLNVIPSTEVPVTIGRL